MNNLPGKWFPILLILSALFWLGVALAGDTVVWSIPTKRTDGAALPITEIAKYQVWIDDTLKVDNIQPSATQVAVSVSPGTHTIKMLTVDTEGRVSPFSNVVSVVVKGPPNAPVVIELKFVP